MSTLIRRRIALAVSATWLGQAVRIGLNLAGLPIMFRFLGQEELGIWLILGQSSVVLSMLVDAGLTPTLTRRIAFAAGKTRAGAGHPLDEESRHELSNLVKSAAITYRMLSVGVFIITFALGSLYLWQLPLHQLSTMTVWTAWLVMCFGYYRKELTHTGDFEMWMRFACQGNAAETACVQGIARTHPANQSAMVPKGMSRSMLK